MALQFTSHPMSQTELTFTFHDITSHRISSHRMSEMLLMFTSHIVVVLVSVSSRSNRGISLTRLIVNPLSVFKDSEFARVCEIVDTENEFVTITAGIRGNREQQQLSNSNISLGSLSDDREINFEMCGIGQHHPLMFLIP
jgi:hypothetical protein